MYRAFSKESYDSPRTVNNGKSYFPSARLAYYFDESQVTAVRRHVHLVWNVALCMRSSKDLAIGASSRISDHDTVPHGDSPAILDPHEKGNGVLCANTYRRSEDEQPKW